jgi:hypothetical protein
MLRPNDLPLICLPTELSDEAAATLVEFLHELTDALEQHYFAQLHRYYHHDRPSESELDLRTPRVKESDDPPF